MKHSRKSFLLHSFFFASGISGLIYQVIWIRMFGNLFGNTVHSVALVTAIFMFGLGAGSFVLGRWADRRASRSGNWLRIYGIMELVIAALGLIVALIFPNLEALSALTSSYVAGENGWMELTFLSHVARYAVALTLLMPITFVMGGTLPILLRFVLHNRIHESAWRIGTLYGINTLGAAVGAWGVDYFLIPSLGLFSSQFVAVLFNLCAGLGALKIAQNEEIPAVPTPVAVARTGTSWPIFVALFAAGILGMGLEILWFRFLVGILGSYRSVLSLLLCIILLGIWLGSVIGGHVVRRGFRPGLCFVIAQCGTVITAFASLMIFSPDWRGSEFLKNVFNASPAWLHSSIELLYQSKVIFLVIGVPVFFMGFAYPLANALVQNAESRIGSRAGALYLSNTVGGMLGALITGYLLLPLLGMKNTLGALFAVSSLATLLLAWHLNLLRRRSLAALIAFSMVAAVACFLLPHHELTYKIFSQKEDQAGIVTVSEGLNETLAVSATPGGRRILLTNGHKMSATEIGDQRYMGAFVHVPLLQIKNPESVLVICFGVGNTSYSASLHPSLKQLEIVDLSKNILGHADYFKDWNHGVLRDPRVKVFINDGRLHLRMKAEPTYDLITLEPPPIAYAGVAALYTKEFYELAKRRLKKGGFMTQWLPINQVPAAEGLALIKAFIEVFPNSVLLNGYYNSLMLMGRNDAPIEFDPDLMQENLASRPAVAQNMHDIYLDDLQEIIGSFVAPYAHLARVTKDVEPVTDDRPTLEYSHLALNDYVIPREIFHMEDLSTWCPKCKADPPRAELKDLSVYMAILDAYYHTNQFIHFSTTVDVPPTQVHLAKSMGDVPAVLAASKYLQLLFNNAH